MNALGNTRGDAAMSVKVYRKNGEVEEVESHEVEVDLPAALVEEYRRITARAKEIEQELLQHVFNQHSAKS